MNESVSSSPYQVAATRNPDSLYSEEKEGIFDVIPFERYWELIRNNKLLIGGVLALCLAIGFVAALLAVPQYRATARIEISLSEQNVTNVEGLQDDGLMATRSYLPTQYELLESHSLALRVVRELNLRNDEEFLAAYQLSPESMVDVDRSIAQMLQGGITISPVLNSSLVDISFSSPSRQIAKKIADGWAEAYIAEDLNRRFGATIEAREFLEERLAQTRERLEVAERDLIAYASDQDLLTINSGSGEGDSADTAAQTLVATELASFNSALLEATADRIRAEAALAARSGNSGESSSSYGSGIVGELRNRRSEVQLELAALSSRFTDDYPPVVALRAQLAQINSAIASEQSESLGRLQADFREARAREANLQERVSSLRGQLVAQRQDSVQYNILQREVDTNRELYSGLLQRYREIGVVGVGESNVLIVDEAREPRAPYQPSVRQNLMLSLVIGILLIAIGLYIFDMLNQSLRNPQQVRERLGLRLLASIPQVKEGEIIDELSQSYTNLYEAYFSLTANIATSAGGQLPRSVMLTSARPGEGKSLSSVALAFLFARQGKRVLLMDCDLRKSGMGKYLELEAKNGVTQYLMGDDDWQSMLVQSHILEGFDILPVGRKSLAVAELLANGRFRTLLDETESAYDIVVVDGPPVLGLVDAPLIAANLGGVVMVIEANEGKWRFIEGAILRLRQANADMLGAAVTKLDERNSMYGYGDGYGYGYGYGDKGSNGEGEPKGAAS